MVATRKGGLTAIAIMLALAASACNKTDSDMKNAAAQALASGITGGRNATASPAAAADSVDFGDDASKFSKDGECDDKRFSGPGMTNTPLLESDVRHDASDCRAAYDQHRLTLGGSPGSSGSTYAASGVEHIQWGDDASKFSKDGECDDKRFAGAGMTSTPLIDSDIQHDASDCRAAFTQGRLSLRE